MLDASDGSMAELRLEVCGLCQEKTDTTYFYKYDRLANIQSAKKRKYPDTKLSNGSICFGFNS